MFEPVIEALGARHRVVVPDLRGHSGSLGLPYPYTASQLAADLACLLDELGIESAAVLGYSQGGAIAQQPALDHPARCGRLLLFRTYAFNMATPLEKVEGHLVPLLINALHLRRLARLVISQGTRQLPKERAEWLIALMAPQDQRLMATAWKETMTFDSRPPLAEIACPTLVVAAADDRAVPMHHANMLHGGIAGSQLVVVDGADHGFIWDHPDELVRLTEDLLAP